MNDAPDAAERRRALDPDSSFIVQAPAGSGKTELLIQRYLALLGRVDAPEEIVAVTFTRKAAAEMRARVLEALAARGDATGVTATPQRLRIQTIDALCVSLTRQMPLLSKFGAQPESIDDARELYQEAARATVALIESAHPADAQAAAHLERLLLHLDNDVACVEALLAEMLQRRDHWLRRVQGRTREELEAALAAEGEGLIAAARALYPGVSPAEASGWEALAHALLTKKRAWRLASPAAQALAALAHGEALRVALAVLFDLPPARYSEAQWAVLGAITGLLPRAVVELKLVFAARGQVDFTEVAQGALRALGEDDAPTDLALALDYRIRHLLIDEFQDTSISQYELVARLTAGWEPGDGRTLFAVGDPMQSIYRFREAEVGLFLAAARRGLPNVQLEPLRLSANFRSQAGIVEWVNATFAAAMPALEDIATGAVPYTSCEPVRPALPGRAVEVHPFFDQSAGAEARKVVELVRAARCADPQGSVAILVRSRTHLAGIVPQLKQAGLSFRAIDIDPLAGRPVVQDLLALTRALAHGGDRLAWLAVLRAPWCGLGLAELVQFTGNVVVSDSGDGSRSGSQVNSISKNDKATVWQMLGEGARVERLGSDARARLERLRSVLQPCIDHRLRCSLREQVEGAWLALGGPACVEDATDLHDAEIYLDHISAREEAGSIADMAAFEQGLDELFALPDLGAGDGDAQIMTIHKAKGLEFDHVIVPGLGSKARSDDRKLFLWLERPAAQAPARGSALTSNLLLAPIQETGADGDAIYDWLRKVEDQRDGFEAARLLYVAATRARQRLHLLGAARTKDGMVLAPAAGTLLAKLWPVVAAQFEASAPADGHAQLQTPAALLPDQTLIRLERGWGLPPAPAPALWSAPAEEARAQDAIEFSWAGETARQIGSVVHRWLQRIAEDGLTGWDQQRVLGMTRLVRGELLARGVPEGELRLAADRVLTALSNTLADERGRWLLGPHASAFGERRLRAATDGKLRTLVLDRTFVADGVRWIVDYKTSRHEGAGLEAFLDSERDRYAPQLESYAAALGGARLGLYFPMLHAWRTWQAGTGE